MDQQKKILNRVKKAKAPHERQTNYKHADDVATYEHPSYNALLVEDKTHSAGPREERQRWSCDICKYQWTPDGEHRDRFTSVNGTDDFNLCKVCMFGPWSAWLTQKQNFIRGHPIIFSNLLYIGMLPIGEQHPAHDDEVGLFNLLDSSQRAETLPWEPTERRELHLSHSHLKFASDRREMQEWERMAEHKIFQEIQLSDIRNIAYLDDVDKHYLVITKGEFPHGEVHFIQVGVWELAGAIIEACANAFEFVYEHAILHNVDDHIFAAVEGRPTAMQRQADEKKRAALFTPPESAAQSGMRLSSFMAQGTGAGAVSRGQSRSNNGSVIGMFGNTGAARASTTGQPQPQKDY